jgi:hypothetical protein
MAGQKVSLEERSQPPSSRRDGRVDQGERRRKRRDFLDEAEESLTPAASRKMVSYKRQTLRETG